MNFSRINTFLLIAIICVNGYIVVLPFVPNVVFWYQNRDKTVMHQLEEKIVARHRDNPSPSPTAEPPGDRLIIPSMLLDAEVHEGKTMRTLRQGLWLRPNGSTPDKGGNTIIVGHRFTYTDPKGVLYHLNQATVGDTLGMTWRGKSYRYIVTEVKVVPPTATYVEDPTDDNRLTIYTCTPLWLPKNRLVVTAMEISE